MNNIDAERRKRLRKHYEQCHDLSVEWAKTGYRYPPPKMPSFPDDLRGMICGAKTQAGTPCKQKALYNNFRCKWHGGLSTGPITEAGKEQSRINGRKGGRPKTQVLAVNKTLS